MEKTYQYIAINNGKLEAMESLELDPLNLVLYHPIRKIWGEWYIIDSDLKIRWNPHFFLEIVFKDVRIFYKKITSIQNAVDIISSYKGKDKEELIRLYEEELKAEKSTLELEIEKLKSEKKALEEKVELFRKIEYKRKELHNLIEKLEN